MKSLFKIFTILNRKQQIKCVYIFILMIFGATIEAIGIGAILPLISVMEDKDIMVHNRMAGKVASMFCISTHVEFIMISAALLIILFVVKNLYIAWQSKVQIYFSTSNQVLYSGRLMREYLFKPYSFHINNNSTTILRNVSGGGAMVFAGILVPTFALFTEIVTAIVILVMLVTVDPFTALIVAGVLGGILYAVIMSFKRRVAECGKIQNACSREYVKCVNQGLGAIKETKVLRREEYFLKEFRDTYARFGKANARFMFINQLPKSIIETVVVSAIILLIVVKLAIGDTPAEIVPLLGMLSLAAFRLMPSANRIVGYVNAIKFQMPFFNEIYDELVQIKEQNDDDSLRYNQTEEKLTYRDVISVEHIAYHYSNQENEVLTDVTFTIPAGKFIGIIGPSGAGKTTFVDILLGLLTPTAGKIFIDGVDMQSNVRGWQANISYVPQSIYLIDGSVKENIALGMKYEDIDDAMIEKVLRMAELYEFINTLPDGVDTNVGERGVKLSGGQRQRIGIARALYYQPKVLILDEATSALDNDTEKSITETILKMKRYVTIIAIAHRISTLEGCDFKVKFENGQAEIC